ncbi:hypothetical protein E2C01_036896 [Portunus trituberculatus]|uniref:Uncharacterized protein n=1 Tax=Portunus trituberculatus TaxID=210409 RepID=A0A5B7FFL2_PORTR|nr:hypothetical protein [Portunus trituberculatus]
MRRVSESSCSPNPLQRVTPDHTPSSPLPHPRATPDLSSLIPLLTPSNLRNTLIPSRRLLRSYSNTLHPSPTP